MWDRQATLEKLRAELAFIESGGYRHASMAPWRATFMFEDSPTCLNSNPIWPRKPCSECVLQQFVPESFREQRTPCRYIPLNEEHESVASLYRTGTQDELEAAVTEWLKATIKKLEKEKPASPAGDQEREVRVQAKFSPQESAAHDQERELHVRAKFIPLD
jgi:hypothetical protein